MRNIVRRTLIIVLTASTALSVLTFGGISTPDRDTVAHAAGGTLSVLGACYDLDTTVFCLDRSASMGWSAQLDGVKNEVTNAILALSPPQEFSIVAFSAATESLSATPLVATDANKLLALQFLSTIDPGGLDCLADGAVTALGIAALGTGPNTGVILIGDGPGGYPVDPADILSTIVSANPFAIPMHMIFIGSSATPLQLYQQVAASSNGTLVLVTSVGGTTAPTFRRGDVNEDAVVDLADPLYLLAAAFIPGSPEPACPDAADADDSGVVEPLTDAITLFQFLFVTGSPPPPSPGISCGEDPSIDLLLCTGSCP